SAGAANHFHKPAGDKFLGQWLPDLLHSRDSRLGPGIYDLFLLVPIQPRLEATKAQEPASGKRLASRTDPGRTDSQTATSSSRCRRRQACQLAGASDGDSR